jgi:hypothetical protein
MTSRPVSLGRRFQGRGVPRVGVGSGGAFCGGGSELLPSLGDGGGPSPGGVDPHPDLSGAAGDAGGDVQDSVSEGVDLAVGQNLENVPQRSSPVEMQRRLTRHAYLL